MTKDTPELACPYCTYELAGLALSNNKATCPECGRLGTPVPRDRIYTHKHLHKQLAMNLLAPTAVPMLMLALATLAFKPLVTLGCLLIFLFPVLILWLTISQLSSATDNSDSSPIRINKALIALWVLLYALPGIMLFLYFMGIGIRSFASIN
tara:strand:+ start:6514 stop:6969 length:456 start_codon:yes stop_codon:yes gene_type:complete